MMQYFLKMGFIYLKDNHNIFLKMAVKEYFIVSQHSKYLCQIQDCQDASEDEAFHPQIF